ncbi:MAG: MFS transporter [Methylorubrum populi]
MTNTEARRSPPRRAALIAAAVLAAAFNLRPALSSVGPLLTGILAETGLSAAGAALLTTLPVLCLGLGAGLGPWIMRRIGADAGVLVGLGAVAAGLALRWPGSLVLLFAGCALAGLGIGLANVLLPVMVKRDFPASAGRMTGLYTMTLCLGAAAGTGFGVPLRDALGGWAPALALWCLPALAAMPLWLPLARQRPTPRAPGIGSGQGPAPLRRDPLAWQVTGFMGLQSSLAYILFGWLPAVLEGRGLSPLEAGFVASVVTLGQAPGALVIATLAARARDQRGWIAAVLVVIVASFLLAAFGPAPLLIPAAVALGLALGGCFGLGLTVIVLRAPEAATAGSLSAMAQGIGYTLAALGPLGFGLAHEGSGGWAWPAALFTGIATLSLACGLGAGRARHVGLGPGRPAAV